jgi:hypothetical protein
LDKKLQEEIIMGEQMDRELDHDIEVIEINKVLLRMKARQIIEKKNMLQSAGERASDQVSKKYPVSLQTTAMIYTTPSRGPITPPEREHKKKRNSSPERAKTAQESQEKGPEKPKRVVDEVTALFNRAKADYESGRLSHVQEELKAILKIVSRPVSTSSKRPKSARPTRNSTFPVSSAFSECDSEVERPNEEFEIDKTINENDTKEVKSKSTIRKKKHQESSTKNKAAPALHIAPENHVQKEVSFKKDKEEEVNPQAENNEGL